MSGRRLRIDALTPLQQGLLAATLIAGALLLGSLVYLAFAIPSGWLIPQPRTSIERDIQVATEAVEQARRLYGTGPTDEGMTPYADAQARLILARLDAGQIDRATRDVRDLAQQFPDHALLQFAAARTLFLAEDLEGAQARVSELLRRSPELESELLRSVYDLAAQIQLERGQNTEAFDSLMKAARIAPASVTFFEKAADLALAGNRLEEAAGAYALALSFNPESTRARDALIGIRTRQDGAFSAGIDAAREETGIDLESLLR